MSGNGASMEREHDRRSERASTETDRGEREQGERKRRSERENRARVNGDGALLERAVRERGKAA